MSFYGRDPVSWASWAGTRTPRARRRDTRNGLGAEHCLSSAQQRSLNAGKQPFSVKYIVDLYSTVKMYTTLTSLAAVGMAATGRYGGVVYALHH